MYGFNYNKKECEEFKSDIALYGIKNGDVIADIGAASGWYEGVLSVFTDSVIYYVQDIDTAYTSLGQLKAVVKHFSAIRERPQTNKFRLVIGEANETLLPEKFFDIIMIKNTYHHFEDKNAMLMDIKTKLKPNGVIWVMDEAFSNQYAQTKHGGCKIKAEKIDDVLSAFKLHGFHLFKSVAPMSAYYNSLCFSLDPQKASDFKTRIQEKAYLTELLEQFNLPKTNKSSRASMALAERIKPSIPVLLETYPSLDNYLNKVGHHLLRTKKLKAAINIFKANIMLFPDAYTPYNSLGEAYWKAKNYSASLVCYEKSLALAPDNKNAKEYIQKIKNAMVK